VPERSVVDPQRDLLDSLAFAQIGAWNFEPSDGVVSGTLALCRIFGLAGDSFRMHFPAFAELVHPADREPLAEALRRALEGDVELALDCRIVRLDGQQRWMTLRARRRVEAGDRARLLGVMWDSTAHVAAGERTRLLASAFEQGGEAIFIADAELGILEVNPACRALTGIGGQDVRGREVCELFAEGTSREQFRALFAAARERGTWQGEVWARTADGAGAPCWLVLAAVRDPRGQVTHHVGSFVDTSERKRAEERIEFLAHHDALTGLPNRFALRGRLEQALVQAARERSRLAVFFIDMDRFKDINDSLGHEVGDLLLLEIARRLRGCVRASDVVARLGGDEFVVVLSSVADEGAAAHMAAKLRQELGTPYPVRGRVLHSSPSIGISLYPEHGDSVDVLMRNADAAMYRAKDSGRNNYQFFDVSLSEGARERIEMAADLRVALEQGAFLLHFQPQMRAADGRFVAAEALIRWPHPERGMVPPDRFIGIAEEFGLIDAIGEWALNQACRELAVLNAKGIRDFRVCVNLSPKQLRDRELPAKVAAAIATAGIEASDLELELTESVAMQDPQSTIQLLNRLYESGVGLAIDDFGTGYSSLSYLKMLPLHNLKLDRSFVRDIEADPSDRAICSATVALAHALGIRVVAEGVESEAQRDFLLALGCDFLQGWLFSKALPADGLARLLGVPEDG
jgi:diguanylate cyclase (GGDEF)-like protein/PAS domain S-box-containing protein